MWHLQWARILDGVTRKEMTSLAALQPGRRPDRIEDHLVTTAKRPGDPFAQRLMVVQPDADLDADKGRQADRVAGRLPRQAAGWPGAVTERDG